MTTDKDLLITDCVISESRELIPLRIYQNKNVESRASLLWVHGGSFISGDLNMPESDWVARQIATAGICVATVDYRLAGNGVRFPVPSNDVFSAWKWFSNFARDSCSAQSLQFIGGASAGGNLAAGVATGLARDTKPSGVILAYPVLHPELPPASDELRAKTANLHENFRFSPAKVKNMSLDYVGDLSMFNHPIAFPSNSDLEHFPKTLIINSEFDDLRSSAETFASALKKCNVSVQISYEPGTCHGHLNTGNSPQAFKTINRIVGWINHQIEMECP